MGFPDPRSNPYQNSKLTTNLNSKVQYDKLSTAVHNLPDAFNKRLQTTSRPSFFGSNKGLDGGLGKDHILDNSTKSLSEGWPELNNSNRAKVFTVPTRVRRKMAESGLHNVGMKTSLAESPNQFINTNIAYDKAPKTFKSNWINETNPRSFFEPELSNKEFAPQSKKLGFYNHENQNDFGIGPLNTNNLMSSTPIKSKPKPNPFPFNCDTFLKTQNRQKGLPNQSPISLPKQDYGFKAQSVNFQGNTNRFNDEMIYELFKTHPSSQKNTGFKNLSIIPEDSSTYRETSFNVLPSKPLKPNLTEYMRLASNPRPSNSIKIPVNPSSRIIDKKRQIKRLSSAIRSKAKPVKPGRKITFNLSCDTGSLAQPSYKSCYPFKSSKPHYDNLQSKQFLESDENDKSQDEMISRKRLLGVMNDLNKAKTTIRKNNEYIKSLEELLENYSKEINLVQLNKSLSELKANFTSLDVSSSNQGILFQRKKELLAGSIKKLDDQITKGSLNTKNYFESPTVSWETNRRLTELEKKYLKVCEISKSKDKYIDTLEKHESSLQIEISELSHAKASLKSTESILYELSDKLDVFITEHNIARPIISVEDSFITGPGSWPAPLKVAPAESVPPLSAATLLKDKITQIVRHSFNSLKVSNKLPGVFPEDQSFKNNNILTSKDSRASSRMSSRDNLSLNDIIKKIQAARIRINSEPSSSLKESLSSSRQSISTTTRLLSLPPPSTDPPT